MNNNRLIVFKAFIIVDEANPNGDPLNGNRPRQHFEGIGYLTPECIKRKIRNRLQDMGRPILIQCKDHLNDGSSCIRERLVSVEPVKEAVDALGDKKSKTSRDKRVNDLTTAACEAFEDVRLFGQTFPLKSAKSDDDEKGNGISAHVNGAVTIKNAKSIGIIDIMHDQITKCVSMEPEDKKGSDTMGHKYYVDYGIYEITGTINPIRAEQNGVMEDDISDIKEALRTLFINDESSARPAGSMSVDRLYWCEQTNDSNTVLYSAKEVQDMITAVPKVDHPENMDDIDITVREADGIKIEEIKGI